MSRYGRDPLRKFCDAYIEAALWSSVDEGGSLDRYSVSDIDPGTRRQMEADCAAFLRNNREDIGPLEERQAGHDFWLTRARHGAGFWDGDWPGPAAKRLTKAAHAYREVDLYVGDDGKVYQT